MTLLIAIAGGLGAVLRHLVHGLAARWRRLLLGTALINLTGSFLLGWLVGWIGAQGLDPSWRAVLGTGFLGGYTTFGTASVEGIRLAGQGRWWSALAHAGGMVVASVSAAALGMWVGAHRW